MYDGTPILEVNPLPYGVIFPDATLQPISIWQFSLRSLGISMRNITDILIYMHIYKTNKKPNIMNILRRSFYGDFEVKFE